MRKRWKLLTVLALLGAAITTVAVITRIPEPQYNGRSLTQWCQQYEGAKDRETPHEMKQAAEARAAIKSIGTNALPLLLRMLRGEESARVKLAQKLRDIPHLWDVGQGLFPPSPFDPIDVFRILGEQGSPAVPELAALLQANTNWINVHRYSHCLAAIGRPALPSLLAALSRPEPMYRDNIISLLGADIFDFGTNIAQAAPTLATLSASTNAIDAHCAIRALGRITNRPEIVLPVLTNALESTDFGARRSALESLGRMRQHANPVASMLPPFLDDPVENVRRAATNALLQISPSLLTNSPAQ